jgi:PKHD-type hydroxylase
MNLENYYACFDSIVPSRICDYIIEDGQRQIAETALVGDYNEVPTDEKNIAKLYKARNSSVVWMNDPWIYREIVPFIREANQFCNWNFDFHLSESCQFTKYSKSQHYTWHQDSWNKPYDRPKDIEHGLIRKLSVTLSLADGNSYEGGDLQFDIRNNSDSTSNIQTPEMARNKGTIVVFPSFVWHRVTPVTKGTRYSLVVWNLGAPFR